MLVLIVLLEIFLTEAAGGDIYSNGGEALLKTTDPPKNGYKSALKDVFWPFVSKKSTSGKYDKTYIPPDKAVPLDVVPAEKHSLPANRVCKDRRGICKGPCREGFNSFNNVCYKYIYHKMDFASAELFCQQEYSGHLASIHCRLNYLFVTDIIRESYFDCPQTWIGLTDATKEGYFLWTDGTKLDHTAWSKGEPSDLIGHQNCVVLDRKGYFLWTDEECSKELNFVCAYALPCK
ncbi:lectin-like [Stegostoma tigrinum]|uniref:lectin-like n=1 Tax=Stegostoma tigrinum TaxID=3053191 RepID=UPI00202B9E63|nr:lectin-like [Stegostoma tigrinum]XP_048405070.1 lectin-like [Stegostoma tigrinum]XP_048405071.1 lectin-like [Stegostoma tigrinum]XP_048405072.1 lectin-like [Stegostoma tigrinum]XP_059508391.1 lectin-like [Stegostoma tigrinum]XP_059508392.1 lectin-like [Stegostoma tigrinum]